MTGYVTTTDLEARITALETRVTELEAQANPPMTFSAEEWAAHEKQVDRLHRKAEEAKRLFDDQRKEDQTGEAGLQILERMRSGDHARLKRALAEVVCENPTLDPETDDPR